MENIHQKLGGGAATVPWLCHWVPVCTVVVIENCASLPIKASALMLNRMQLWSALAEIGGIIANLQHGYNKGLFVRNTSNIIWARLTKTVQLANNSVSTTLQERRSSYG